MSIRKKTEEISQELEETKTNLKKSVDNGVKKTKSFMRKLFMLLFLGLILAGIGYYFYANYTYSEGSRTGYLTKMSKKGMVLKTFEGQLNLGGIQNNEDANIIGNIWNFSVLDDRLYYKLEEFEGKKVTLRYKQHIKALPWQGETNYFVYEVEEK